MKLKKHSAIKTRLFKGRKIKYTEMTVYADLVIKDEKTCLQSVGITEQDKVYKDKPEECSKCKSDQLISLEVLGTCNKILFWNCPRCDHLHLKFSKSVTESHLKKGKGLWTNPNDWIPPTKETLN